MIKEKVDGFIVDIFLVKGCKELVFFVYKIVKMKIRIDVIRMEFIEEMWVFVVRID